MLSHLRFHRRGPSSPASPTPDQQPSLSPLSSHDSPLAADCASPSDARPPSSSSTALPPMLPPITRVTSHDSELRLDRPRDIDVSSPLDTRPQHAPRSLYNGDSGFIGGVALRNYRRGVEAQQAGARSESGDPIAGPLEDQTWRQRPKPTSISTEGPSRTYTKPMTSFSTPTELQNSAGTALGRRPAGTRLPNDAPLMPSSTVSTEPQRGKKGLPFLKNPMSTLLMRRKNNQNAPDLRPLPLTGREEEPVYDPRIRGTRVHDFSAPRRKQNIPGHGVTPICPSSQTDLVAAHQDKPGENKSNVGLGSHHPGNLSNASDSAHPGSRSIASQLINHSPSTSSQKTKSSFAQKSSPGLDGKPAPPVPPKDDLSLSSRRPSSSKPLQTVPNDAREPPKAAPSQRTTRSRTISLSEMSALPKHMKSTSSRFSFDMVGAAKQEKLLEERHRQRELEKQTTGVDGPRDSRFDDFDEDAFDYDAMMDDDGLEEKIPGVNADVEDDDEALGDEGLGDEPDPDDDQENFAGFVFQRSNPASSLASPHSAGMTITPRDAHGKVIGFAVTKDMRSLATCPLSPDTQPSFLNRVLNGQVCGLGIQEQCVSDSAGAPEPVRQDELYFDDGMVGLEDGFAEDLAAEPEVDGVPFDESIFDNNDTDQFGRPVPGAFAQAQSQRRAANQDPVVKRESDVTSRFSAQSDTSRSTAHTSLSADGQKNGEGVDHAPAEESLGSDDVAAPQVADVEQNSVAAYQAALAAAAHKAAATGKFQRSSSPPRDEEPRGRLDDSFSEAHEDEAYDDFGSGYVDMDDLDLDDDAIIAEANASALANDSDGWYGQEFGFYSAPMAQQYSSHNSTSSNLSDYEFANGGVFGPKGAGGLDRSTSGRMVSREPNLTPITERSEYSNRNSLMSLAFPPLSSSTPIIQSPGLAQLAMMADRGDEQMTLSALLRLRSKAWGGSQASLASSRDGSPKSDRGEMPSSPWSSNFAGPVPGPGGGHRRRNSAFSTVSRDSEGASTSGSPTLTMACPTFAPPCPPILGSSMELPVLSSDLSIVPPSLATSEQQHAQAQTTTTEANETPLSAVSGRSSADLARGLEGCNTRMSSRRSGKGHHRHKSSADSVSYLKEEESGETRWVIEWRRTAESGQVEILEREVVEGGRI
ncbi:Uncharacterized protein TPAR_02688 [Tolypocladium paradoxum]|uniref:Uncharacterized protein n=1 Tax=Tolypocladium paradoxum TaxID=94208 RepID=A0A2S4L3S2_9HYPO|nr:Uncharacterized protein TPAR_02688 [Tolypocladium paradoxum]